MKMDQQFQDQHHFHHHHQQQQQPYHNYYPSHVRQQQLPQVPANKSSTLNNYHRIRNRLNGGGGKNSTGGQSHQQRARKKSRDNGRKAEEESADGGFDEWQWGANHRARARSRSRGSLAASEAPKSAPLPRKVYNGQANPLLVSREDLNNGGGENGGNWQGGNFSVGRAGVRRLNIASQRMGPAVSERDLANGDYSELRDIVARMQRQQQQQYQQENDGNHTVRNRGRSKNPAQKQKRALEYRRSFSGVMEDRFHHHFRNNVNSNGSNSNNMLSFDLNSSNSALHLLHMGSKSSPQLVHRKRLYFDYFEGDENGGEVEEAADGRRDR